jgi:hypothetical protein
MIRKNLAALCLAALTASICVAAPPALAAHKVTIEVYDQSNWQSWTCYGPTRKITDFTCPDQMFDEVVITAEGSRKVLARGELYWQPTRNSASYDETSSTTRLIRSKALR